MSGQLTQAGANRAVAAGVGQAVSASAAMYLALGTALPGTPDTASLGDFVTHEITAAGYARQVITWAAVGGDPSLISNAGAINFGDFTADPPSVGYTFLCTTSLGTAGNALAYWTLDTPRDAGIGDSLQFSANQLTISVD